MADEIYLQLRKYNLSFFFCLKYRHTCDNDNCDRKRQLKHNIFIPMCIPRFCVKGITDIIHIYIYIINSFDDQSSIKCRRIISPSSIR